MAQNIVTNADDVDLFLDFNTGDDDDLGYRVIAQDFTITVDQTINSVGGVSQNVPKGLTKGDLEYSFSFTIEGEDTKVMRNVSDSDGDSIPFDLTASKPSDTGADGETEWEYALITCLAETEEISATTDETVEMSVEGMAAVLDKDV